MTYSQCSSLDAGTAYDLYYSLTPSGASAIMEVGIAADADGGWVGIGFPQSGQEMVGSDAVIAKTDAASTTGAIVKPLGPASALLATVNTTRLFAVAVHAENKAALHCQLSG